MVGGRGGEDEESRRGNPSAYGTVSFKNIKIKRKRMLYNRCPISTSGKTILYIKELFCSL